MNDPGPHQRDSRPEVRQPPEEQPKSPAKPPPPRTANNPRTV